MQKQAEKSASRSADPKKTNSSEESKDYRNVPPPHKFSDSIYDEQKKQIAEDIDEAVQIAAEFIKNDKSKKQVSKTAVSTNDEVDVAQQTETKSRKRRNSEDALEEGELKTKKPKERKGAGGAFFIGIDLEDYLSDDEEEQGKSNQINGKS